MQQLIQIEQNIIGAEKVNSVNARDLHVALHVKKDFSDWFKSQISNLGLEENVNYLTVHLKGEGGKFGKIEYIITQDTAKHISMASRTEKGKEVRDYFIEMEKKALHVTPQNFTMRAIAEMANGFLSVEQDIAEVKADMSSLKNTSALTATDCFNYQKAVKFKVDSIIAQYPTVSKGVLFSQIHGKVKEFYKVASYKDLPHFKINELLEMVNALHVKVA